MNGLEALNKLRELNKSGDKKYLFDIIEKELKPAITEENGIKYISEKEAEEQLKKMLGIKCFDYIAIHYAKDIEYYEVFENCIAEVYLDGGMTMFNNSFKWLFGKHYEVITKEEFDRRREKRKAKNKRKNGIIDIDPGPLSDDETVEIKFENGTIAKLPKIKPTSFTANYRKVGIDIKRNDPPSDN